MTRNETLARLPRRILLPVLGALGGLIGAVIITAAIPAAYQATSSVLVLAPGSSAKQSVTIAANAELVQYVAPTITRLAESGQLAADVADELGYPRTAVAGRITATFIPGEQLIELTGTAPSSAQAVAIADGAANALSRQVSRLSTSSDAVSISIVDRATPPTAPVSPRPLLNAALGIVLGFLAGLGFVSLRDRTDNLVREQSAVAALTGLPVVGALPRIPRRIPRGGLPLEDSDSLAQASDAALSSLSVLLSGLAGRTVLVADCRADHGAAAAAACLALRAQRHGQAVVLDDRTGRAMLDEAVARVGGSTGGPEVGVLRPGPATVFGAVAPLLAGPGLEDLAADADAVLIVIFGGRTSRSDARRAAELVGRLGDKVAGVLTVGVVGEPAAWPRSAAALANIPPVNITDPRPAPGQAAADIAAPRVAALNVPASVMTGHAMPAPTMPAPTMPAPTMPAPTEPDHDMPAHAMTAQATTGPTNGATHITKKDRTAR